MTTMCITNTQGSPRPLRHNPQPFRFWFPYWFHPYHPHNDIHPFRTIYEFRFSFDYIHAPHRHHSRPFRPLFTLVPLVFWHRCRCSSPPIQRHWWRYESSRRRLRREQHTSLSRRPSCNRTESKQFPPPHKLHDGSRRRIRQRAPEGEGEPTRPRVRTFVGRDARYRQRWTCGRRIARHGVEWTETGEGCGDYAAAE